MSEENEEIVRRFGEVLNRWTSVDAVMAELEPFVDPEVEYVNPADAVERGTRKGIAGMRTALENFFEGAGAEATVELEELEERGERIFTQGRIHAQGGASGAEVVGPPVYTIYTFRDGRVIKIEWHLDVEEARRRFDQNA